MGDKKSSFKIKLIFLVGNNKITLKADKTHKPSIVTKLENRCTRPVLAIAHYCIAENSMLFSVAISLGSYFIQFKLPKQFKLRMAKDAVCSTDNVVDIEDLEQDYVDLVSDVL